MKPLLIAALLFLSMTSAALAQADIIYTGTAQPSIEKASITGAQRGATVTMELEGLNLGGATEAIFSAPGFQTKVLAFAEQMREKPKAIPLRTVIVDKATLNRATIEITVAASVEPGIYRFRLRTAMGASNAMPFVVTPLVETTARRMNQTIEAAQEVSLPTTIAGSLARRGETDYYKFKAKAGRQIVFEIIAASIGSRLNSVLTLYDAAGRKLAMNDDFQRRADSLLGYTFEQAGEYIIGVTDAERGGMMEGYEYRLNAGEFAYLTGVFPLGARQGATIDVKLSGFNLPPAQKLKAPVEHEWMIRASGPKGESLNRLRMDAGRYPEIAEVEGNNALSSAQTVSIPSTINGRLLDEKGRDDFYRFHASKGQTLILDVAAQGYGSPLDSVIEVLDLKGAPIPRAVLRSLLATETTLNDRDSAGAGLRLLNWNGMAPGDFLLVGNELTRIERLPYFPDDDTILQSIGGVRYAFEDTTPEAHANGTPVYKTTIHPPGATFSSNGLPVVTLYYRNDDAGPLHNPDAPKDSRLQFTAPADSDYFVRIRDVRGFSGDWFAYRLSIHPPQPDFSFSLEPENLNIPSGGSRDLRVRAMRRDGFDGEIEIKLKNLPAGFSATTGRIPAGQHVGVVILSASGEAKGSFPILAEAIAVINGRREVRTMHGDEQTLSMVSVAPPPEVAVFTKEKLVDVAPGDDAFINISIERREGFGGRVPFEVVGLPPGVTLRDLGLNGIMITEGETTARFRIDVQPWVKPSDQQIFIVGRIETTGRQLQRFPAAPITLSIKAKERMAGGGR
jgi:hypothetical protein